MHNIIYFILKYSAYCTPKYEPSKNICYAKCWDNWRKIVALLHDIMEDTDITEKEISDFGIQKVYIDAVKILTKKSCESYDQYINRIIKSKNQLAINVKIVDLEHNMNLIDLK